MSMKKVVQYSIYFPVPFNLPLPIFQTQIVKVFSKGVVVNSDIKPHEEILKQLSKM